MAFWGGQRGRRTFMRREMVGEISMRSELVAGLLLSVDSVQLPNCDRCRAPAILSGA